jgi:AcrR family transcriptional regulator
MTSAVQKPQQQRSIATYGRMLDAAEALLQKNSFDAVSVKEIAHAAGVTIGAFYTRFPDKEALLGALEDRVTTMMLDYIGEATQPERWSGVTLEEGLRRYCFGLIDIYAKTRGAGRALVLRSHTDAGLKRRLRRLNVEGLPRVLSVVVAQPGVTHERPELAVEIALLAIRSVLRETVLFGEAWPGEDVLAPDVLAAELARLSVGYLGIRGRRIGRR